MKRKFAFVALLLLAAICVLVAFCMFRAGEPNSKISEQSYRKIHTGTTEAEVLEIMASPPGHYATSPIMLYSDDEFVDLPATSPARIISWIGNKWGIVVWLDEN